MSNWNDPLSIDIQEQLSVALQALPPDSPFTNVLRNLEPNGSCLPTFSRLLMEASLTILLKKAFRPLLVDLCARWLDDSENLDKKVDAFALLVEVHEEITRVMQEFFRQPRMQGGLLASVARDTTVENVPTKQLHRALLAYYRILRACPMLPEYMKWDLTLLHRLFSPPHADRGVCWLAIRCYALQTGMGERNREEVERRVLGDIGIEDCSVDYGEDINGALRVTDGWLLPVTELHRIQRARDEILSETISFCSDSAASVRIKASQLSPRIANVHGVMLLKEPSSFQPTTDLVLTESAIYTLRQLALRLSLRLPVLLTSAPSSGKSTMLHHLAAQIYPASANHIVTINLADTSMDPRSLLGSYVSSSKRSGTFEWKDGVLVQAMRAGKWVVLKDADRGSGEALGLLTPLIESLAPNKRIGVRARMFVQGRGHVEAADSFMLFGTRSTDGHTYVPPSFATALKWAEVVAASPSATELKEIVETKFPLLAGAVADVLIDIWQSTQRLRTVSSTRRIGIRDLEKFCRRVTSLLKAHNFFVDSSRRMESTNAFTCLIPSPSLREDIFLDARDVFFASSAPTKAAQAQQDAIGALVGERLGLSKETQEWVLRRRIHEFEAEKDVDGRLIAVRAGRTRLLADASTGLVDSTRVTNFNMHKPALKVISQLATCVASAEPVLLTGETGTGKTTIITYLASVLNRLLLSLNLSNQTESSDLIGGFKPINARIPALELQNRFVEMFAKTFSKKRNESFETSLRKAINDGKWKTTVKLWFSAAKMAMDKIKERVAEETRSYQSTPSSEFDLTVPRKRQKTRHAGPSVTDADWLAFENDVQDFEMQHVRNGGKFAFQFVEGPLVKAIRSGSWVLLDEINLASPETLECIASLLQSATSSVTLTEQGSLEPVPRHPNFRIFACMNPATDVGKKDLPTNIRSRFTEINVPPPDKDRDTLLSIITHYIGNIAVGDKAAILDVAQFYASVKELSESGQISDGCNHRPHYNMRTLSRALTFAIDVVQHFGLRRALWEGFTMAFSMVLNKDSEKLVSDLARRTLLSTVKNHLAFLSQSSVATRTASQNAISFGPFALPRGPNEEDLATDYILSPSVQKKLIDLARIILTGRFPVLIQGPTSSGKTSAVHYLARRTGHRMVRINNHEHTDIQEYLGMYVTDAKTGKLVYRDGLLVQALRRGDWIVLDELNLAPTDVLEALNRLLDDNHELLVPETHEVIKPHPHFMLFATQNPPGAYGGRKVLSRALRSRFLEVHFDDVPQTELEYILSQRTRIAPSYSQKIVAVFSELQKRRQVSRIFEGKQGFATLRDLFRWAGRDAGSYQELAENGYMLLAERGRREEDKVVVKEIIERTMNVVIPESTIYDMLPMLNSEQFHTKDSQLVWTKPMQRLFTLISRALQHNEPVLLVGETGTGKTSVCQLYADIVGKQLKTVNGHQNLEAADIIGGQRPLQRGQSSSLDLLSEASHILAGIVNEPLTSVERLQGAIRSVRESASVDVIKLKRLLAIERILSEPDGALLGWQDGALLKCMREGNIFLLDEISLADDSVLERLNSVLEPSRTIVLAERGGQDVEEHEVKAVDSFQFIATMNPGGDFGKKELSPALRNRFTEIWVPSITVRQDLEQIINKSWLHSDLYQLTKPILDFIDWVSEQVGDLSVITVRDILGWVRFCNVVYDGSPSSVPFVFGHGARMSVLDGLASLSQLSSWSPNSVKELSARAFLYLQELLPGASTKDRDLSWELSEDSLRIGPFSVRAQPDPQERSTFSLDAPTALDNAMRVLRACQISRPILLEGSPGVGKTSLVTALADAAGQRLARINLSEQTDIVDLFGSDLPVEGGRAGQFMWRDAEFLSALQSGGWVLLDEMNLAPQAILEGLNAVFDHRGTVYIPELDRSFVRHPNFRVFAAQNPLQQGSGRKGLPKSFLNRFTKVYIEPMTPEDMLLVCRHVFPELPDQMLQSMISFNCSLSKLVTEDHAFGRQGAPWEFNLRDVLRWCTLSLHSRKQGEKPQHNPHVNAVYACRFRSDDDRARVRETFEATFGRGTLAHRQPLRYTLSPHVIQCGISAIIRGNRVQQEYASSLVHEHISLLEAALSCISHNWLLIMTGSRCSGKSNFVRCLAQLASQTLREVTLHSASDTSDLIGSFEQVDDANRTKAMVHVLIDFIRERYVISPDNNRGLLTDMQELGQLQEKWVRKDSSNMEALQRVCLRIRTRIGKSDLHLQQLLDKLLESFSSPYSDRTQFHWVDGPLVDAMKQGQWILLNDVNRCGAAVLDRLNSLCELGGQLILTEKGQDQAPVNIHQKFRLIMAYDPSGGEISRAMRNRGIEVALTSSAANTSFGSLLDAHRLPLSLPHIGGVAPTDQARFEEFRRALSPSCHNIGNRKQCLFSTSIIHEDSISARVGDVLNTLDSARLRCADSTVLFLYHFTSPGYPLHLLRLVKATLLRANFVETLEVTLKTPREGTVFDNIRRKYEHESSMLSSLLQYQPLNFFLSTNVYSLDNVDMPDPGILGIAIDVFVMNCMIRDSVKGNDIRFGSDNLRVHVVNMIESIERVTARVLSQGGGDQETLRIALELLSIASFLCDTLATRMFDFTIAHIVAAWMQAALETAAFVFDDAKAALINFRSCVRLKSGRQLMSIWKAAFPRFPHQSNLSAISRVFDAAEMAAAQGRFERSLGVQRRLMEVVSLQSVSAGRIAEVELNTIFLQLCNDYPSDSPRPELAIDTDAQILPVQPLLIAELFHLAKVRLFKKAASVNGLLKLIAIACPSLRDHFSRMLAYQRLLWTAQAVKDAVEILPDVMQSHIEWHKAVWRTNDGIPTDLVGPSFIFLPSLLHSTLEAGIWGKIKLDSFQFFSTSLTNQEVLAFETSASRRPSDVLMLLVSSIVVFCAALGDQFDELELALVSTMRSKDLCTTEGVHTVIKMLSGCRDEHTLSLLEAELIPSLTSIATNVVDSIGHLGRCWIALADTVMDSYIPDLPVDPRAALWCRSHYWKKRQATLASRLYLHTCMEQISSGQTTNITIARIQAELEIAEQNIRSCQELGADETYVGNALRLRLWEEVRIFRTEVISKEKILSIMTALKSGDPASQLREQMLQESLSNFMQRMQSVYNDSLDLYVTIELALLQLKFGLRLVALAARKVHVASDHDVQMQTLVSYPSAMLMKAHQALPSPSFVCGDFSHSDDMIMRLCSMSVDVIRAGNRKSYRDALLLAYDRLLTLWHSDRSKAAIEEKNAQSLYRHSGEEQDEELEDIAIRQMFPTYEDGEERTSPPSSQPLNSKQLMSPQNGQELLAVHMQIFYPETQAGASVRLKRFIRRCAETWMKNRLASLSDASDACSFPFRARLIRDVKNEANCAIASGGNFYVDANVPELKRLHPVLWGMRQQLHRLILTWPDQTVLQHLAEHCDKVLSLRLDSPVAKALTSVEQLLQHTDDWEMYANRDNSLQAYRQSLTDIIVDWRKLELSSWRGLLDNEAKLAESSTWEWWFRLYEILIHKPSCIEASADCSEDANAYVNRLNALLEDFVRGTPLGQFQHRIKLLRSFKRLLEDVSSIRLRSVLPRITNILDSLDRYYSRFLPKASTSLSEQRTSLENDIRDFIKLASWRDVNVHSLRQSAKHSHRQLYRKVRKFREILRQPITPFMVDAWNYKGVDDSTMISASTFPFKASRSIQYSSTPYFAKYSKVFIEARQRSCQYSSATSIDNLAITVVGAAEELAQAPVPANLDSAKLKKWHAARMVRKRRAWNDLLKELKKTGIAQNVKPEALSEQTNRRWLMELKNAGAVSKGDPCPVAQQIDTYFYRSMDVLSDLRGSMSNHHDDITTRDLSRGVMLAESTFNVSIRCRRMLTTLLNSRTQLSSAILRLRALTDGTSRCVGGDVVVQSCMLVKDLTGRMVGILEELRIDYLELVKVRLPPSTSPDEVEKDLDEHVTLYQTMMSELSSTLTGINSTNPPIVLEDELLRVTRSIEQFHNSVSWLDSVQTKEPIFRPFCEGVKSFLSQEIALLPRVYSNPGTKNLRSNDLVETLLVIAQKVDAHPGVPSLDEDDENHIHAHLSHFIAVSKILKGNSVVELVQTLLSRIPHSTASSAEDALSQAVPLLDEYMCFMDNFATCVATWNKAILKLLFIISSIMRRISKEGFCRPPEGEDKSSADGPMEAAEGTGFGEGSGQNDVTDQIEDEGQVEGLHGDQQQDNKPEQQNENDALEVDADMFGDVDGFVDEGGEEDENADGEEEEEQTFSDLDDEMDKHDGENIDTVDENFWDAKDEEETQKFEEKTNEQSGQSEMAAKEEVEKSKGEEHLGMDEEQKVENEDAGDREEDQGKAPEVGQGDEVDIDEKDRKSPDPALKRDKSADDEVAPNEDDLLDDDAEMNDGPAEGETKDDEDSMQMEDDEEGGMEDADSGQADDMVQDDADETGQTEERSGAAKEADITEGGDPSTDAAADSKGAVKQARGEPGSSADDASGDPLTREKQDNASLDNDSSNDQTQPDGPSETNAAQASNRNASGTSSFLDYNPLPNPLRNLGDALKEVRRRVQEIQAPDADAPPAPKPTDEDGERAPLEYAQDSEDVEMQALGPAGEEEVERLGKLRLEEQNSEEKTGDVQMGEDAEMRDIPQFVERAEVDLVPPKRTEKDKDASEEEGDTKNALSQAQARQREDTNDKDMVPSQKSPLDLSPTPEPDAQDATVEAALVHWRSQGQPSNEAHHIWRLYESLTHHLSFSLCEQLRLILEPTKATRLQGDFRTGKRLNMKKIIPYIASDYTKDKIWLRRTRPSQREYQVLIALDDSRSMAESHAVHLALETLALVSKALNRLEVGDVAVARFGSSAEILHDFSDGPFTDAAGAKVVSAFKFDQNATDVLGLLETSVRMLGEAREKRGGSGAAAELWQLIIIISDGVCQEHEKLRATLRKAVEQRVLVVFVVIDAKAAGASTSGSGDAKGKAKMDNSIVNMTQAMYKNVDGRMELHMQRYLDSFPFEFFAILKSVETLPEVLSDTLKQFFERVVGDTRFN